MTAVVGDWCNIWLITTSASGPFIKAFEITSAGLNPNPVVSAAAPATALVSDVGTLKISPDGRKLAATQLGFTNAATLFDFSNGLATNPRNLLLQGGAYGVEFSPDNTKLYVNAASMIQFDLSSNNTDTIIASAIPIGPGGLTQLKLAPDGKIYCVGSAAALSRIPDPNTGGVACGFEPNAIPVLGAAALGLPNVVPIMITDTLLSSQQVKAGCFVTEQVLQAQHMAGTWGYLWNNGTTTPTLVADTPGTYWVSYRKSPCILYTDTFKLEFPYGTLPQIATLANCTGSNNGKALALPDPSDTNTYTFTWTNAAGDTSLIPTAFKGCPAACIPSISHRFSAIPHSRS